MELIKILFFADSHLGFDYPIRPRIERRRRGHDFFKNHTRILKYVIENKVDLVIHGGDFFFRTRVPEKIVSIAYQELYRFAEKGIPIIIVPGNHESSRLPTSQLFHHPNIFVFRKPETFEFIFKKCKISISGFPFIRKDIQGNFNSIQNNILEDKKVGDINILCMHQAIEGAQVGPSNYTFRKGIDVVNIVDLSTDFHCILSGHIHRKQILWKKDEKNNNKIPIIYPGSIERTSFAEKDEEKGFFILEFKEKDSKPVLDNLNFVKLPTRPMIDLELKAESTDREAIKAELSSMLSKISQDAVIRLKCPDESVMNILSSKFIREIAPPTMNIQLKGLSKFAPRKK